jgi:hypothetical protein
MTPNKLNKQIDYDNSKKNCFFFNNITQFSANKI